MARSDHLRLVLSRPGGRANSKSPSPGWRGRPPPASGAVWQASLMPDLGHLAIGSWSGGRFMHFGEPLDDDRLVALLRPDETIRTVVTADVYGRGEADRMVGRAVAGMPRDAFRLVGMVGHDFTSGERQGAKGYPGFTDPAPR